MTAPTRPVLRWHGSKWRIAEWVISNFPPHRVCVEPFGGSAGVLLRKPRVVTDVYNDLDGDVVNLFRVIRDRADELARAIALTPYAREEYQELYEPCSDDLERARRFMARSFMGMSSKGAIRKSGFDARINPDGYVGRLRSLAELPGEILIAAARFTRVLIENVPAIDLLERYDRSDVLIYLDPPYVASTRSHGKLYRHEMTDDDHARLLKRAQAARAMVCISGYHSDLYDEHLGDWRRVETDAYADDGRERIEVLWLNPAAVDILDRDRSAFRRGAGMPLFRTEAGAA